MSLSLTRAAIGEDVEIVVKTSTSASDARKVHLSVSVRAVNYIGVSKSVIKNINDTVQVTGTGAHYIRVQSPDYRVHKFAVRLSLLVCEKTLTLLTNYYAHRLYICICRYISFCCHKRLLLSAYGINIIELQWFG